MTKLKSLDLFSGIGGFSHALHAVAKTVAYCEIDPSCQAVLKANMRRGAIHKAPLFDDVTKLSAYQLKDATPQLITAGFPCQDISIANPHGQGLKGKRSGLFSEVLRLVDTVPSIQLVFLENSSRILKVGFKTLKRQMANRGFALKYILIRASDVGALHKRLRWYCLCYKPGALPLLKNAQRTRDPIMRFKWSRAMGMAKVKRIRSHEHKAELVQRCKMLGNSIVPQCALWSWNILTSAILTGEQGDLCSMAEEPKRKQKLRLVFSDRRTRIIKDQWATPCFSVWHNYTHLTHRGSRLLSNQTFYYKGKIPKAKYNQYTANPMFVECLMGYPPHWTHV